MPTGDVCTSGCRSRTRRHAHAIGTPRDLSGRCSREDVVLERRRALARFVPRHVGALVAHEQSFRIVGHNHSCAARDVARVGAQDTRPRGAPSGSAHAAQSARPPHRRYPPARSGVRPQPRAEPPESAPPPHTRVMLIFFHQSRDQARDARASRLGEGPGTPRYPSPRATAPRYFVTAPRHLVSFPLLLTRAFTLTRSLSRRHADHARRLPSPSGGKFARPYRGAAAAAVADDASRCATCGERSNVASRDASCQTDVTADQVRTRDLGEPSRASSPFVPVPTPAEDADSLAALERLIETRRAALVARGVLRTDDRGNYARVRYAEPTPPPVLDRRSPRRAPRSRRQNSLGGDGDVIRFDSPLPDPERVSPSRPEGPTPRKMRGERRSADADAYAGMGHTQTDVVVDARTSKSSSSFSSPRPVPPSSGTRRSPTHKYSVSPGSNGTRHFAAAAPRVEDEEVGGVGEAFRMERTRTRAKPLARRLADARGGRAREGAVEDAFDSAYDTSAPSSSTHSGHTSDDGEGGAKGGAKGGARGGGKDDAAEEGGARARFEPTARRGVFSGGGGAFGAYRAAEATSTSREVRGEGSKTQKSVLTMSLRREAERR